MTQKRAVAQQPMFLEALTKPNCTFIDQPLVSSIFWNIRKHICIGVSADWNGIFSLKFSLKARMSRGELGFSIESAPRTKMWLRLKGTHSCNHKTFCYSRINPLCCPMSYQSELIYCLFNLLLFLSLFFFFRMRTVKNGQDIGTTIFFI